jgi:hypothetical protein
MKYLELATRIAKGTLDQDKNSFFCGVAERSDGAIVVSTNVRNREQIHATHCENRLLKKCDVGSIIWLVRVLRDGTWANAKPCIQCQTLLKNKRVKKIFYTIDKDTYAVWEP